MPSDQREHWQELAKKDMTRFEEEKALFKGSWKVPTNAWQKDPTRPKKPAPAYFAFSNARRQAVKHANPKASNAEVSKFLSKMWQEASPELKQHYGDEETRQRAIFLVKLEEWRQKKESGPGEAGQHSIDMDHQDTNDAASSAQHMMQGESSSFYRPHYPAHQPNMQQQQSQQTAFFGGPSEGVSTSQSNSTFQAFPDPQNMGLAAAAYPEPNLFSQDSQGGQQPNANNASLLLEQLLQGLVNTQQMNPRANEQPQAQPQPSTPPLHHSQTPSQDNTLLLSVLSIMQATQNSGGGGMNCATAGGVPTTCANSDEGSANSNGIGAALGALLTQSLDGGMQQGSGAALLASIAAPHRVSPQPPPAVNEESDPNATLLQLLLGATSQQGAANNGANFNHGGGGGEQYVRSAGSFSTSSFQQGGSNGMSLPAQQQPQAPPQNTMLESALLSLLLPQQQQQQRFPHDNHQYSLSTNQLLPYAPEPPPQPSTQDPQQFPAETMNLLALTQLLMSSSQQQSSNNDNDQSNRGN
jgi:hypothetical protein